MKTLHKFALSALTTIALSTTAHATVFIEDMGSTGVQTFSYMFDQDFSGFIDIGVSNEGDMVVNSSLDLISFSTELNSVDAYIPADTSSYYNTLGEAGTNGEIFSISIDKKAGEFFTFDWLFETDDYNPFNDFAFIEIEGLHYEVLAEIATSEVPLPATLWLLGSAMVGFAGFKRRVKAN